MILIFSWLVTIITTAFFAKRYFIKRLQRKYEKSLLNGDKFLSSKIGKEYYLALDEATRKAKGIIDIEEKISDDFRAFNGHSFPTLS